ncbi:predicted protein [Lichtheimia corymbifera JMRC:FSU:9682]|uniref:Uncharacterized protein n=1 Tax=Lichtheimia corymbifera JMRC:FSU:9682 TaxID=1263082 RepID=A0A068S6Z6_9FUNG|nr:predicted protein [Lichtheimia corymbifera JMRC:FSU:9682]
MRAITKTTMSIRTKSYTKAILDMFPKLLLFGEKYAIMMAKERLDSKQFDTLSNGSFHNARSIDYYNKETKRDYQLLLWAEGILTRQP